MKTNRYTITELKYPNGKWQGRIRIDDKETNTSQTFDAIDLRCFLTEKEKRFLLFDELVADHQNLISEFLSTIQSVGVKPLKPNIDPRLN